MTKLSQDLEEHLFAQTIHESVCLGVEHALMHAEKQWKRPWYLFGGINYLGLSVAIQESIMKSIAIGLKALPEYKAKLEAIAAKESQKETEGGC